MSRFENYRPHIRFYLGTWNCWHYKIRGVVGRGPSAASAYIDFIRKWSITPARLMYGHAPQRESFWDLA